MFKTVDYIMMKPLYNACISAVYMRHYEDQRCKFHE